MKIPLRNGYYFEMTWKKGLTFWGKVFWIGLIVIVSAIYFGFLFFGEFGTC